MDKRKVYLDKMPLAEAQSVVLKEFAANYSELATEVIAVEEALGRVNINPLYAEHSTPHYYASAMDGVAVKVEDTFGASSRSPKSLEVGREVFYVDTGEPIPEACNGVIMIEKVNQIDEDTLEITEAATPGQHIRPIGEDILATELVLTARQRLGAAEIGSLLAAGITELEVAKAPEIAILPTGTELIEPGEELAPGKIIEYNSRVISAQIKEWGAKAIKAAKVIDDYQLIKERVKNLCSEYELLLIIAGSSAGSEDYTAQVIEDLGELLFHGVAISPGKPMMVGLIEGKLVIGVPGYPVAAYLDTWLFVKPLVESFLGLPVSESPTVKAKLAQSLLSKLGQEEFVRVKLARIAGELKAVPLKRGAGVINSVSKADGFARIPALSQGLKAKVEVEVELFQNRDYQQNLVIVGEQIRAIDELQNQGRLGKAKLDIYLQNSGIQTALEQLVAGAANLALIAEVTANNEDYLNCLEEYCEEAEIVNLVSSTLGLAFKSSNPLKIASLQDLSESELVISNRALGTAPRQLLDLKLEELQIEKKSVEGYTREVRNELEVANLIKEGLVDVGIVNEGVAQRLGLDFIPLGEVDYNLVIPELEAGEQRIQSLRALLLSSGFRSQLEKIAGYNSQRTGKIIQIVEDSNLER